MGQPLLRCVSFFLTLPHSFSLLPTLPHFRSWPFTAFHCSSLPEVACRIMQQIFVHRIPSYDWFGALRDPTTTASGRLLTSTTLIVTSSTPNVYLFKIDVPVEFWLFDVWSARLLYMWLHQEKGRQLIYLSCLFHLIPCHLDASKMSKQGLGLYNVNK